jgi:predicted nucleic acid-binding protein
VTVVVADTAPLRYLVQIECVQFLPKFFVQVLIPAAVWHELLDEKTPTAVRQWAEHLPPWMEVRHLRSPPDSTLAGLDAGERDAIQLAHEIGANVLLVDERAGARLARNRGLIAIGTLGILLEAAELGFIPIDEAIARLSATNFRRTSQLFDHVRELARRRGVRTTHTG